MFVTELLISHYIIRYRTINGNLQGTSYRAQVTVVKI